MDYLYPSFFSRLNNVSLTLITYAVARMSKKSLEKHNGFQK